MKRKLTNLIAGKLMLSAAVFAGILVFAIALVLIIKAHPLFITRSITDVILGSDWQPSIGKFGLWPFIVGTFWVTGIAVVLAVPVCIFASIYLSEFAHSRVRAIMKPLIDILAAIPSVVYGVWGVLVIIPFIADKLGPFASKHWKSIPFLSPEYTTGFCLLAGGIVLAIMIIPIIISVFEEVLRAVPVEVRDASYHLGATSFETVYKIVLKKALPGLAAAIVLGVSRALGETMAVVMVVGGSLPLIPKTLFDPAYPLPALIANNYGETMSIRFYDSALLSAALVLMVIVLTFNIGARVILVRAVKGAAR